MHFVSEMQEKYPELNDIQNSENLFFNQPDGKISVDLKQIFNDICVSALPGGSSAFINDFIQRIKESINPKEDEKFMINGWSSILDNNSCSKNKFTKNLMKPPTII